MCSFSVSTKASSSICFSTQSFSSFSPGTFPLIPFTDTIVPAPSSARATSKHSPSILNSLVRAQHLRRFARGNHRVLLCFVEVLGDCSQQSVEFRLLLQVFELHYRPAHVRRRPLQQIGCVLLVLHNFSPKIVVVNSRWSALTCEFLRELLLERPIRARRSLAYYMRSW